MTRSWMLKPRLQTLFKRNTGELAVSGPFYLIQGSVVREHEEEDDQLLQKLHQDAIQGKFRMKRRDRGVGFEDDSDEDDDDDARRIRRRIHKKRKIEGDSLEALG